MPVDDFFFPIGPDAYPANITGFNKSSTSLFVEWEHIPPHHRNGILQGYSISYAPRDNNQPFQTVTVDSPRSSTTLVMLKKYTWYVIRVAGFTSKGLGPYPLQPLEIRTSEDGKSRDSSVSIATNGGAVDQRLKEVSFTFVSSELLSPLLPWTRSRSTQQNTRVTLQIGRQFSR